MAWQGPPQCEQCGIRHIVLFADLSHDDFSLIHKPIDVVSLPANAVLYSAGSSGAHVYTVREGLIKLVQYLPNGEQRIVRLLKQGDVVGMEALLGQPFKHTATVLQPVSACQIPVEVVERLNRNTPRIHRQLMTHWQRALNEADAWLTELSIGSARVRVARLLLRLTECCSDSLIYLPNREDLGAMLAITTETASRVIARFKRGGCLQELDNDRVRINRGTLEKIAFD